MHTIYQQRRNLELALDRFNWAAKTDDQIPAIPNVGLIHREKPQVPSKDDNEQVKGGATKVIAPQRPRKQQHELELVPPRKRLKQSGTGGAGPSTSKAANTFSPRGGNPAQQKQKGGGGGGGGGPSKPTKDNNPGGGGNGGGGGGDDDDSLDHFDPADEDLPKAVDTQCAQCDDGGFLIDCIGRCRRTFHVGIEPEEEAGGSVDFDDDEDDDGKEKEKKEDIKTYTQIECNSINMPEDLAIALATSSSQLVCPSCLAYEQRCYCCGKSDEEGTKVRPCLVASCGHFYHPACMKEAKKKLSLNHAARSMKEMCPLHWCCKCKKQGDLGGNGTGDDDLEGASQDQNNELVQCRRCPTAYHRGCIPSSWNGFEGQPQRAWMADFDSDGHLLPGCTVETSMLYCEKHELDNTGVAKHTVPLFTDDVLKAWSLHYAKEFPHLESSKKLLREKGILGRVRESPAVRTGALGEAGPLDASAMRATTEIDALLDARKLLEDAKNQIDIGNVKSDMVQPYPYRNRSKRTIDRGVLANLEATMHYVQGNTSAEDATLTTLVRRADIQAIDESYRFLSYYMSPYIYPANYYSFGRIFMKKELIKQVVIRLSHLIRNGDCIVDLNCDDLRNGNRLIIGVKPPHGKGIRLSNAFIEHVATFSARIIALVVPVESIIPRGYTVLLEDRQICNGRDAFYDPSTNRTLFPAEAGDHVFRVLVRSDLKHSVFEMNGGGGEKHWEEIPVPGRR